MDVLPKYGIALRAFARLQMNVVAERNNGFEWFDKINQEKVYLPVLWFEEGVAGPSEVFMKNSVVMVIEFHTVPGEIQLIFASE